MTTDQLIQAWQITPELAQKVCRVQNRFEAETGRPLEVISGYRSAQEQRQLEREGRPAAPVELSNHTICPARAVDVRIEGFPARSLKIVLGRIATEEGLRWGGGSPIEDGIPLDWNHLDLGPRQDQAAREYRDRAG